MTSRNPRVLVVEDNALLLRSIVMGLQDLFDVTKAADGEEARAIVAHHRFDAVLVDVLLPGLSGLELLRLIRAYDLDVPVIMMTGMSSDGAMEEALDLGAHAWLEKPVDLLVLRQRMSDAVSLCQIARAKRLAIEEPTVDSSHPSAAIGDRAGLMVRLGSALDRLTLAFQPIVDVNSRRVAAFEVLMRSGEETLPTPAAVLDAAERLGAVQELGRAVRTLAAASAAFVPSACDLFVNVHPAELADEVLYGGSCPLFPHAARVVLEVTERASIDHVADVKDKVRRLRNNGFRIAVDDLGAGYAGLTTIAAVEPEVVKIDMALVRGIEASMVKQRLVRMLVDACKDMRMRVVAEGVETREEAAAVVAAGVDMIQGFYVGRPGPTPSLQLPLGW